MLTMGLNIYRLGMQPQKYLSPRTVTHQECAVICMTPLFFLSSILHADNVGFFCSVGIAKCSYRGLILFYKNVISVIEAKASESLL